jgi:hypothetical protein
LNYLLPHEDSIRHGYRFEMRSYLLKFLRPLTWLLWGMLIIGMIDHFLLDPRGLAVLPEWLFDWLLILMWPVLLAVWFGWKEHEKQKSKNSPADTSSETTDA